MNLRGNKQHTPQPVARPSANPRSLNDWHNNHKPPTTLPVTDIPFGNTYTHITQTYTRRREISDTTHTNSLSHFKHPPPPNLHFCRGGDFRGFAEASHRAGWTFFVSMSAAQPKTAPTVGIMLTEVQCKIACSKVHK